MERMPKILELRPRAPDSEKVTINLGFVDLGQIDLLVLDSSNPRAIARCDQ